jgi:hypothetical protein
MNKQSIRHGLGAAAGALALWVAGGDVAVAQVIASPELVAQVKVGMSEAQVKSALGRPASDITYPLSGQRVLTYQFPGGRQVLEISLEAQGAVRLVQLVDASSD